MKAMKAILACLIILVICICLKAQSPAWVWAQSAGSENNDDGYSIAYDGYGNCYITGFIGGPTTFGGSYLPLSGLYVAKIDIAGNWVWAVQPGMSGYISGTDICITQDGNIIVTGYFTNTAIFGDTSLTSYGYKDIYVAKLNTAGDWLWATQAGGVNEDYGSTVTIGPGSSIYLAGSFKYSAIFGQITLSGIGNHFNMFVAKLDSNGNWLWANRAGGDEDISGRGVAVDSSGNSFVTGHFRLNWAVFGNISLNISMYDYSYVTKLDASGAFLWVRYTGGLGGESIAMDSLGSAYVTGTASGDVFVAKISSTGDWLWTRYAGGPSNDYGCGIETDVLGNVYVVGRFYGTATFGTFTVSSSSAYHWDTFVAKLDSSGNWLWVKTAEADWVSAIDISQNGDVYVTGQYHDGTGFDEITLPQGAMYDIYVGRISEPGLVVLSSYNVDFGDVYIGAVSEWIPVVVKNGISSPVSITALAFENSVNQFEVNPPDLALTLFPGDIETLYVRFVPHSAGNFIDTLRIFNDSPTFPVISIRLEGTGLAVEPLAPTNLVVTFNGNDATLSWDAVTESIFGTPMNPDYYIVFTCNDPNGEYAYHGATAGLQYPFPIIGLFNSHKFFRVKAFIFYDRDTVDFDELGLKYGQSEEEVTRVLRN